MKIEINKMTHTTPTLRDVPNGDLFLALDDNEAYVKTSIVMFGIYKCVSLRDGTIYELSTNTKVRLVHKVDILVDDFPKNMK